MNYIITGTTTTARVNKSWQEIKLFVWLGEFIGRRAYFIFLAFVFAEPRD